jgi:demethoxyubiquinone hydroxylase (CLK1/Coq7/Cat5 family)
LNIFPLLVCCPKENLATLISTHFSISCEASDQGCWRHILSTRKKNRNFFSALRNKVETQFSECEHIVERIRVTRVGELFAHWVIVYFGQVFFKITEVANIW